jgi:hypothetical protein
MESGMILLTHDLRERLLANGRRRGLDHVPVVKFFNPLGIGTWLATEFDEDGDTLFGLAGLGDPELGSFSLLEMQALELPLGMGIERDFLFEGEFPLSVYAQAARTAGRIVINERSLRVAVAACKGRRNDALPPMAAARPREDTPRKRTAYLLRSASERVRGPKGVHDELRPRERLSAARRGELRW